MKLSLISSASVCHMLVKVDHGRRVASMVHKSRDGGHLALLISLTWTLEGTPMLLGSRLREWSLMRMLLDMSS